MKITLEIARLLFLQCCHNAFHSQSINVRFWRLAIVCGLDVPKGWKMIAISQVMQILQANASASTC